jgi:hypothetical protein
MAPDPETPCPEALHHGPPTAAGRCPWCGRKFTYPRLRTTATPHLGDDLRSVPLDDDIQAAYRRTYDPDWGVTHGDTDPVGSLHRRPL